MPNDFAEKIIEKIFDVLGSVIKFILLLLGIVVVIVAIAVALLHYKGIKPMAERLTIEYRDDLKFVGGLMAFSCVIPDYFAISDDVDETMEIAEQLKDRAKECKKSFSSFARCAGELAKSAVDADKRTHAIQSAKKAKHAYDGVRRILSNGRLITRDLPDYDDKTRAIKTALDELLTHFMEMGPTDILQLDEDGLENQVNAVMKPNEAEVMAWMDQAETRYEDLLITAKLVYVINYFSPALGGLTMEYLNQYGFDEIMREAPAFERARQKGCLQGNTLLDATIHFAEEIEKHSGGEDESVTIDE